MENFLIHAGRRRGFRWRRGHVLTVKYWVSIHFHLSLILKLTKSLGWVLSCRVKLYGATILGVSCHSVSVVENGLE